MTSARGPYQLKKRAERRDRTRLRLVAAAADLHGEVGPAFTTMADVAARAGVSKMTAYRHFPTDLDLFRACGRHFVDGNPLPNPESWADIPDPVARLRTALREIYAYYRRHARRISNVLRDSQTLPVGGAFREAERAWRDSLLDAWPSRTRGRPGLRAAVALGVNFEAWRHLVESVQLSDRQVIEHVVASAVASSERRA